jgi:thioredoxin reductase
MSEPIKRKVKKTKIGLVGRITDPVIAESIIEREQADYVGMTRALIADPYLPKKAMEGRLEEIRPCIGTLEGCWGRSAAHDFPMRCSVNAAVGREAGRAERKLSRAPKKKKVLVIGAGPAGLEAARVAALRGHEVVVYEKGSKAGGLVNIGKLFPGRADVGSIVTWLEKQVRALGIRIEYNREVPDSSDVAEFLVKEEEKPDALVLATGSSPIKSGIQMITFQEVPGWKEANAHSIDELLTKQIPVEGKRVLVADSTTYLQGPAVCEWLTRNGASSTTFVTPQTEVSPEMNDYNQLIHIVRSLQMNHVNILTHSWIKRIDDGKRVIVYNIPTGTETEIEIDEVILHTGRMQNNSLRRVFDGMVEEIYEVGDCRVAGGKILAAIDDGYRVGMQI